jgi:hypothetical protein
MLATNYAGAGGFFFLVPAILLLLAVISLFFAYDGKWWALPFILLPAIVGCFFAFLVLFYLSQIVEQLGLFYLFWFPIPLIVAVISVVMLIVRRRALKNKPCP